MTLILTLTCWPGITQVTDRRLIQKTSPKTARIFDHHSNKNIVLLTSDAVVAIAYTGSAFLTKDIKEIPTDEWIAQEICPELAGFSDHRSINVFRHSEPKSRWPSLDQVIYRLIKGLPSAIEGGKHLTIVIDGWSTKDNRVFPIHTIVETGTNREVSVRKISTVLPQKNTFMFSVAPIDNMADSTRSQVMGRISETKCTWYERESVLVDALREISNTNPFVGPDCFSITIGNPRFYHGVAIRYLTPSLTNNVFAAPTTNIMAPVAFRPWILSDDYVSPPQRISFSGPTQVSCGSTRITIHAPDLPDSPESEFRSVLPRKEYK